MSSESRTVDSLFELRVLVFSNMTIHDTDGRHLRIVDYGLGYGFQWPGLLRVLAAREGSPPELRHGPAADYCRSG